MGIKRQFCWPLRIDRRPLRKITSAHAERCSPFNYCIKNVLMAVSTKLTSEHSYVCIVKYSTSYYNLQTGRHLHIFIFRIYKTIGDLRKAAKRMIRPQMIGSLPYYQKVDSQQTINFIAKYKQQWQQTSTAYDTYSKVAGWCACGAVKAVKLFEQLHAWCCDKNNVRHKLWRVVQHLQSLISIQMLRFEKNG